MSANDILNQNEIRAEMVRAVQNHWAFYLAEGIVLFALGVITIIVPPIATLGVTIVIGWLFFTSGAFSLIMSFFARRARGYPTRRASERKCSQYAHPTLSPPLVRIRIAAGPSPGPAVFLQPNRRWPAVVKGANFGALIIPYCVGNIKRLLWGRAAC